MSFTCWRQEQQRTFSVGCVEKGEHWIAFHPSEGSVVDPVVWTKEVRL